MRKTAIVDDPDLKLYYNQMKIEAQTSPVIAFELQNLEQKLKKLRELWTNLNMNFYGLKEAGVSKREDERWERVAEKCREMYCSIEPTASETDTVKEWKRRCGYEMSIWERLKASALVTLCDKNKMWFHVAGGELCQLKADMQQGSRTVTAPAYIGYKPRRRKRGLLRDDNYDDDGLEEAEEEDAAAGAET